MVEGDTILLMQDVQKDRRALISDSLEFSVRVQIVDRWPSGRRRTLGKRVGG